MMKSRHQKNNQSLYGISILKDGKINELWMWRAHVFEKSLNKKQQYPNG